MNDAGLTVAVTGPTGTFGAGLVPLLERDDRIATIIGIARRPFDPASHGWEKMRYHRGDVRDDAALVAAFDGADVVVHLAFQILGGDSDTRRAINVDGTLNAFHASIAAGAKRFVYASSVAAYGFHRDNPVGMKENWPTRPAKQMFYAQEKAEIDNRLQEASAQCRNVDLYLLRPPIVLGPHALGAKDVLPFSLDRFAGPLAARLPRSPLPLPVPVADIPIQFIHEDDVGAALLQCVLADGPPGAYNIAGDGIVSPADIVRELGLWPVRLPARPAQLVARWLTRVPDLPSYAQWIEAMSHPAIMDTTRAKTELHWTPRYSGLEAVRATLGR